MLFPKINFNIKSNDQIVSIWRIASEKQLLGGSYKISSINTYKSFYFHLIDNIFSLIAIPTALNGLTNQHDIHFLALLTADVADGPIVPECFLPAFQPIDCLHLEIIPQAWHERLERALAGFVT
jgi:hypothetical protein